MRLLASFTAYPDSASAASAMMPASGDLPAATSHTRAVSSHGAVTTTVVAKETRNGRMMAVHARHEYAEVDVPGLTSTPEMYFGDCALVP